MFRFFCTRCNKVKRVQNPPTKIQNIESTIPSQRLGECNRHSRATPANVIRRDSFKRSA